MALTSVVPLVTVHAPGTIDIYLTAENILMYQQYVYGASKHSYKQLLFIRAHSQTIISFVTCGHLVLT